MLFRMWAIVYGNNIDDQIMFTSFEKAQQKLILQALLSYQKTEMFPRLVEYTSDNEGAFRKAKYGYNIDMNKLNEHIHIMGFDFIKSHPNTAFDCIKPYDGI